MRTVSTALASATALLIAGCASSYTPTIVSANDRGVTYRISPDRIEDTREQANAYCEERGRTARQERITPTGDGNSVAVFSCY